MDKLEIDRAIVHTHPIHLALQKSAILRWNEDFIFLIVDGIDKMTCDDPTAHMEVNLKMAHKLQLQAMLSYCHELFHKKGGGVASNAPF